MVEAKYAPGDGPFVSAPEITVILKVGLDSDDLHSFIDTLITYLEAQ